MTDTGNRSLIDRGIRPSQTSLIEGYERPVGKIPESVAFGDNAGLIASVAPLYLDGSVLDVTYGRGMWWRLFKPETFQGHDLATDGVDFRKLPYEEASWDTVCFDPPYVPRQGPKPATKIEDAAYRSRYGLDTPRGPRELERLIFNGMAECSRVARAFVLAKCCDYVNCRRLQLGHLTMIRAGEAAGLRVHDLLILAGGTGPGGSQITTVKRARRAHSYLVVFAVPRRRTNRVSA